MNSISKWDKFLCVGKFTYVVSINSGCFRFRVGEVNLGVLFRLNSRLVWGRLLIKFYRIKRLIIFFFWKLLVIVYFIFVSL